MSLKITNLTPHPVTIVRSLTDGDRLHLVQLGLSPAGEHWGRSTTYTAERIAADSDLHVVDVDATHVAISRRTVYPACAPADLPRAIESAEYPESLEPWPCSPRGPSKIGIGDMALTDSGSDGQGGYENAVSLHHTKLVDFVGYVGVEDLPVPAPGERMFGFSTFYIVSIVTAIGALAAGRGIENLLVPMGQVRDANGRIVGATGLAPATSLLTPLYRALTQHYQRETIKALEERNEARRKLQAVAERVADLAPSI